MGRGGRRSGKPGVAYPQRTDLQGGKLPVQTGPSSVYGEGEKLRRAQQVVPMGGTQTVAAPPTPPVAATPPAPLIAPGDLPPLTAPTDAPDEPLTAGMGTGPGPGPEVLGGFGNAATRPQTVSGIIEDLSAGDVSGEVAALFQFAQQRGL